MVRVSDNAELGAYRNEDLDAALERDAQEQEAIGMAELERVAWTAGQ